MNRQSQTRGAISPRGYPHGRSELRAECLLEGLDPAVEVMVRLQQPVERHVLDANGEPVESLFVAGKRYASREEMAVREVRIPMLPNRSATVRAAGSKRAELVENGAPAGVLLWHWEPLHGTVEAWIDEIEPSLRRVRVHVANRLEWDAADAEPMRQRTLYSTEVAMHSPDGAFVSLAHPPPHLRHWSAACHNEGLWPVPVGKTGDRRTLLASGVPLEDYPQLRPGSLAELFSGGGPHSRVSLGAARHAA